MIELVIIAVLEAVVHLGRIRSAVSDRAVLSGLMTFCTCGLRVSFVAAGVSLVIDGVHPLAAVAAYGGAAGLATALLQGWVVVGETKRRSDAATKWRGEAADGYPGVADE